MWPDLCRPLIPQWWDNAKVLVPELPTPRTLVNSIKRTAERALSSFEARSIRPFRGFSALLAWTWGESWRYGGEKLFFEAEKE